MSGLVDRAQERGLVTRTASTLDRRSVRVIITAAGRELAERAKAGLAVEMATLVADLDPVQRSRLSAVASLIVAADARRRGIDIFDVRPVPPRRPGSARH